MTKFWIYFFSYLVAIAIGIIIGMLIDSDNVYKVMIRKIKQKGEGNTLDSALNVNLTPKNESGGVFSRMKKRRKARRAKRKLKKINAN